MGIFGGNYALELAKWIMYPIPASIRSRLARPKYRKRYSESLCIRSLLAPSDLLGTIIERRSGN